MISSSRWRWHGASWNSRWRCCRVSPVWLAEPQPSQLVLQSILVSAFPKPKKHFGRKLSGALGRRRRPFSSHQQRVSARLRWIRWMLFLITPEQSSCTGGRKTEKLKERQAQASFKCFSFRLPVSLFDNELWIPSTASEERVTLSNKLWERVGGGGFQLLLWINDKWTKKPLLRWSFCFLTAVFLDCFCLFPPPHVLQLKCTAVYQSTITHKYFSFVPKIVLELELYLLGMVTGSVSLEMRNSSCQGQIQNGICFLKVLFPNMSGGSERRRESKRNQQTNSEEFELTMKSTHCCVSNGILNQDSKTFRLSPKQWCGMPEVIILRGVHSPEDRRNRPGMGAL